MTLRGASLMMIDLARVIAAVITIPAIAFAAIFGSAAYGDFDGRGCFVGEAMQCSDARTTMAMAIAAVVVGPVMFLALTILRKLLAVREGVSNA